MQSTQRIQFTERTSLRRLHFAMIAIRKESDADTIEVHFQDEDEEAGEAGEASSELGTHLRLPLSETQRQRQRIAA